PVVPLLAEIESVRESRQAGSHGPIADEQYRVGTAVLGRLLHSQGADLRSDPVAMSEQNLSQRRARPRTVIQRHAANRGPGDSTEKRHAQNGSVAGNADTWHQGIRAGAEILDDRYEAHLQLTFFQLNRESARVIQHQLGVWRQRLQVHDEWF